VLLCAHCGSAPRVSGLSLIVQGKRRNVILETAPFRAEQKPHRPDLEIANWHKKMPPTI
jgi:hypothetical protein